MAPRYRKSSDDVPPGYFAWEAAGLRWLADAGGAEVVEMVDVGPTYLDLQRLESVPPDRAVAERLGHALATTHAAGAPAFGAGPTGWTGDGWLGPLAEPLPLTLGAWDS